MIRTQISLDPKLHRLARQRAAERGSSLAAYIRQLLARDLSQVPVSTDPSIVFDLGASGGSDIARDKDDLIGRAIAAERKADYGTE